MASGGENTSLKEQVSLLKEIHSLQQKQTSLIKKQTVDNKQLSASEKSLESVKKRQSVLNSKEASEISNINRLNSEKLAKLKEEAIGVTANVGEYQKLQQQYALLKINALNLGAAHGQNSIQFQEAAKKAAHVREQMRLLNKSVGDNTLNVGNYESATFSLVQVFRELPAFAYGAQIGIGSLSNNLVPLFSNFKAVANSIDDNTQKVVGYGGALKIFARQLLGLNFIASVGVLIFYVIRKRDR